MSAPAIRTENLAKAYPLPGDMWLGAIPRPSNREVPALSKIDLRVSPGEIYGLLGPNGAGKSTLLRILATLVLPDTGNAWICGANVRTEEEEVRSRIGVMLEHERSFFGRLTGRHNLAFFADLQGIPRDVARTRIERLLQQVELTDAADRRVQTYSLGMHHRMALARALLNDPDVLLLDEPTRSLDPEAKEAMGRMLRGELAESGKTILLLTHDLETASTLCDRIGFLVGGEIRAEGRPKSLVDEARAGSLGVLYREIVRDP